MPREKPEPYIPMKHKFCNYEHIKPFHEFIVARVDWDWRNPVYESYGSGDTIDMDFSEWCAKYYKHIVERFHGSFHDVGIQLEHYATKKWLKTYYPNVYQFLKNRNITYTVESSGDVAFEYDINGKWKSSSGFTVAVIRIKDNEQALLFKMSWC